MHNSFTTRALTRMGYGSRPYRVPLLSAKKQETAAAVVLRNKNTGHWKMGKTLLRLMNPSSCCGTLMGGLGYGENHEYMRPSCCVSTLQADGVIVWGVISWHTLVPLIKVEQRLHATGYLNIITFMAAVYPSAHFFSRIMPHATRLGLSRNGSKNITVNSAYCSGLPSHQISIQSSICGMRWSELFRVEVHSQPT